MAGLERHRPLALQGHTRQSRWTYTAVVSAVLASSVSLQATPIVRAADPEPSPTPSASGGVMTDPDRPSPGPRTGPAALIPDAPVLASQVNTTFKPGDLFISNGPGQVQWRLPDGSLNSVIQAQAQSSGVMTGMAFDAGGTLYVTNFGDIGGGAVIKVNNAGQVSSTIQKTEFRAPESAVTDGFGRLYVGQAGSGAGNFGPNSIHKLDLAGNEIAEITVAEDRRGADWIDLAADKCTIRYTSEGTRVLRFNVCTGQQLSDFAGGLHGAYAIRITPDGGAPPGVGAGANLDVTAGAGYQYSTADTLSDLAGPFGGAGGSAAVGFGGYANVFGGAGRCEGKIVNGVNAGAAVGGGASASATATRTWTFQLFGPPDPPCFTRPLK